MEKVAPTIIDTSPYNGEINVSVDRTIRILFHENIFEGPSYNNIAVKNSKSEAISIILCINKNRLFLEPDKALEKGEIYTVIIPKAAVVDKSGNKLEENYRFHFYMEDYHEDLKIIRTNPDNNEVDIPIDKYISISFNMRIKACENYEKIILKDENNNLIPINKQIFGAVLMVTPIKELDYKTKYELVLVEKSVCSFEDIALNESYILKFETEKHKEFLKIISTEPKDGESDVYLFRPITINFNEDIYEECDYDCIKLLNEKGYELPIIKKICSNTLYIKTRAMYSCRRYLLYIPKCAVRNQESQVMKCNFSMSFSTICN